MAHLFETKLQRALEGSAPRFSVVGTHRPAPLAYLLSQVVLPNQVHLLVCPTDELAESLSMDLEAFGEITPRCLLLGGEASVYSGLSPSPRALAARVGCLHQMNIAQPGEILIASVQGLMQKTADPKVLFSARTTLKKGDTIDASFFRLLRNLAYADSPQVEDVGQYAARGGLLDIFSPAHPLPVRIEFFGDQIESMRLFDPETQRSTESTETYTVIPSRETLFEDETKQMLIRRFIESAERRGVSGPDLEPILHDLSLGRSFPGLEGLLPHFFESLVSPLNYISRPLLIWTLDELDALREQDLFSRNISEDYAAHQDSPICPEPKDLFLSHFLEGAPSQARIVSLRALKIDNLDGEGETDLEYKTYNTEDLRNFVRLAKEQGKDGTEAASERVRKLVDDGYRVVLTARTKSQAQRLHLILEQFGLNPRLVEHLKDLGPVAPSVWISTQHLSEGFRDPEAREVFLTDEDFFLVRGVRREARRKANKESLSDLTFADLRPGEYVVHIQHGVGIFDGLKVMAVGGIDAEFLQLTYKDGDRLYLPVYRIGQIQKFTGLPTLDKLGGSGWQKTKIKVRNHLRDIANDLLQLYAKRAAITRPPVPGPGGDYRKFEALFPYDETADQLQAIDAVLSDLAKENPMDRLICGDVGFGKTEIALRAAYLVAAAGQQVAVLVPTTVLAFQHLETFRRRFKGLPFRVEGFSRFSKPAQLKENLSALAEGKVDIAIGTHRLLSKDVSFKNLGLLVVDEEQRFGVSHKEKVRKLRTHVDTLTLSATPIPRTLNMSLVGIRDLSLITTPPRDRLPIRTFVCKFDSETVRKAILAEIQRGGQVYYIHNRVQSIYALADELKALVPEARIRIGHGQMPEGELEEVMVQFFKHEFDVLLCTTIIESGVDIPRANTMIVDRSDTFGLSQLYQLRGRIGRSKERAYCYLLIPKSGLMDPDAQERLRVLQENTMLGSGIRIAHHDLELRGAGNILGDEQSGHINAVGFELYLELLEEALHAARGEPHEDREIEPEMNLRIPALIPDAYIPDIRIRLAYYKRLTHIQRIEDLDEVESDLRDQFGPPPDQVLNLLGVMLIRRLCKELGIRDISAGPKSVSLAFTEKTKVEPRVVIDLTLRERTVYSLTPDSRLIIKSNTGTWMEIYEHLIKIRRLAHLEPN